MDLISGNRVEALVPRCFVGDLLHVFEQDSVLFHMVDGAVRIDLQHDGITGLSEDPFRNAVRVYYFAGVLNIPTIVPMRFTKRCHAGAGFNLARNHVGPAGITYGIFNGVRCHAFDFLAPIDGGRKGRLSDGRRIVGGGFRPRGGRVPMIDGRRQARSRQFWFSFNR